MIFSISHRFIFFANGRCATTSISEALAPYQQGTEFDVAKPGLFTKGHIPPVDLRDSIDPNIWASFFKFVFVRNPWDWVVSQYFYNFRNKQNEPIPEDYRLNEQDVLRLKQHLYQFRAVPNSETLLQSSYATDEDGRIIVDFVGRFENLPDDLAHVCRTIGIEWNGINHLNSTRHQHCSTHLTREAEIAIAEIWAYDIELFDYALK